MQGANEAGKREVSYMAQGNEQYLVCNTTREQREKIVLSALGCSETGCEECSGCGIYGAGNPLDIYQDYIDGIKEISEVNEAIRLTLFRG